jgi:hypothetical protein
VDWFGRPDRAARAGRSLSDREADNVLDQPDGTVENPRVRSHRGRGPAGDADADVVVGGSVVGMVLAAICFLIILAAIGWGIYEVYQIGHPAPTPPAK